MSLRTRQGADPAQASPRSPRSPPPYVQAVASGAPPTGTGAVRTSTDTRERLDRPRRADFACSPRTPEIASLRRSCPARCASPGRTPRPRGRRAAITRGSVHPPQPAVPGPAPHAAVFVAASEGREGIVLAIDRPARRRRTGRTPEAGTSRTRHVAPRAAMPRSESTEAPGAASVNSASSGPAGRARGGGPRPLARHGAEMFDPVPGERVIPLRPRRRP